MFMQAGFALVETGLCRAKSAAHVMATNFMIYGLGMLGFWVCGFAFMFGNYANGPAPIGWQPSLGTGFDAAQPAAGRSPSPGIPSDCSG